MANPRSITYGAESDYGTLTIKIKRSSDPDDWWDSTLNSGAGGFTTSEPSPHLDMTYDSEMKQYYVETIPTSGVDYSIFDSAGNIIAWSFWGGTFPEAVDPGSASAYTMQEIINRIRAEIRDPGGDNPLYSTTNLLLILDRCNGWLKDQLYKRKADIGVKKVTYVGDGTEEWNLPTDHYGIYQVIYPDVTNGGNLRSATITDYDRGLMAQDVIYPSYYVILSGKLYFIIDLGTGTTINFYYYGRVTKLEATTTVPYDGLFMDLMVEWGKTIALRGDEFDATFEEGMLRMFMVSSQNYISHRSYLPKGAALASRHYMSTRGRNRVNAWTRRSANRTGRFS